MSTPFAFLLTFIAGGITVWLWMKMSRQVQDERMEEIRHHVEELGGLLISASPVDRHECAFADDFHDPDKVYKFYQVNYDINQERHQGWVIQEMKQPWYGPSGAIHSNWVWHL
ncbi:hypothetical protein [Reinekea marinisedimentorum]|uniref:Uncharacterized protein n=1 Tax=Reinekea marinisedimentorum TaxID=230495 RepID=A0A4R3ICB3_9GAMM|nr:hypothetical protein [Reinekea marinisedimentorum]TCS43795.1 hypothetical protein BCF53_101138 [Reinekea marinisedimentorum]